MEGTREGGRGLERERERERERATAVALELRKQWIGIFKVEKEKTSNLELQQRKE
jgi:hypothetical protein